MFCRAVLVVAQEQVVLLFYDPSTLVLELCVPLCMGLGEHARKAFARHGQDSREAQSRHPKSRTASSRHETSYCGDMNTCGCPKATSSNGNLAKSMPT